MLSLLLASAMTLTMAATAFAEEAGFLSLDFMIKDVFALDTLV